MKKSLVFLASMLLLLSAAVPAAANECLPCGIPCNPAAEAEKASSLSLGLGVLYTTSPYKSHDDFVIPFPLIDYSGQYFYVQGAGAGVYLLKNEKHRLNVGLRYSPFHFDNDDVDDPQMRLLDNRRHTAMADLGYEWYSPVGLFGARVSRDILGYSDGFVVDLSYGVPFYLSRLTLMPVIGVQWWDDKQSDYYFSVSHEESARSGIAQYTARNEFLPYAGLKAKFQVADHWEVVGSAEANLLTDSIRHSPMINNRLMASFAGGVQFTF